MFIIGLFLMSVSVIGLIGVAFVQARYPDALEGILLPIEGASTKAAATGKEPPMAGGMMQPDSLTEMEFDELHVNSINRANIPPVPPSE